MKKKFLSIFLAILMVVLMVPVQAMADDASVQSTPDGDTNKNGTVEVTFTVSDGTENFYIPRVGPTFTTELSVPYFDLGLYGLESFYYNPDCYNYQPFQAGTAETAEGVVTVMHVLIYATEILMCQFDKTEAGTGKGISDGGENVFDYIEWSPDQGAGSTFITSFWNRADELERGFNFNYYLNFKFPMGTDGTGSTSDQQSVKDGDYVDLHLIVDTSAYGSEYQFFETSDGKINKATVNENESAEITLYKTVSFYGEETSHETNPYVSVYYISEDNYTGQPVTEWTEFGTTDENGKVATPSDLAAGTYYISAAGEMSYESYNECAPAAFVLKVESAPSEGEGGGDEGGDAPEENDPEENEPEITSGIHGDTNNNGKVEVNMTISEGTDGFYVTENQTSFFYEQMSVPYFDLALYDLEHYYYNPDCYSGIQQAGTKYTAEGVVTSMHVFIYATEKYMLDLPENELGKGLHNEDLFKWISWSQGAGSSFMDFWNGSTNLNYYLEYQYPLGKDGWGSTSDQQALVDGSKIDIHLIKDQAVTGSQYLLFETNDGTRDYYEIDLGESLTLTLKGTVSSFNGSSDPVKAVGDNVYYISAKDYAGQPVTQWTKLGSTDENGQITVPDDLAAGTYYVSCLGRLSTTTERGPAAFVLKVKRAATDYTFGDVNDDGAIDSVDAVLVLRYKAGTIGDAEFISAAADVNGDNAVDSVDAVLILRHKAGTIIKFPVE